MPPNQLIESICFNGTIMEYLFVGHGSLLKFLSEISNLKIQEVFIETTEVEHLSSDVDRFNYERLLWVQGVEYKKKLVHYCLIRLDYVPLTWNRQGIFGESKEEMNHRLNNRCDTARESLENLFIKLGLACRFGLIAMPNNLSYVRGEPGPLKLIPDQHAYRIEF